MAKVLWTQKQDIGPRRRMAHAMAFEDSRQRVLLFGGDALDGTLFGDTWEWDGEAWTQVQDIGPGGRAHHAMAHDGARGRSVLFGGRTAAGPAGDTWEWDGESWTQVADTGPPKRFRHAMAFDSVRGRVVLFGGEAAGALGDTWGWDGAEWVQLEDTGPSGRVSPAMTFDSARGRVVLFGGAPPGGASLGDTWEWDGTAWTEEADFGPNPSAGCAMVFNGSRSVLYGGIASMLEPAVAPLPAISSLGWEWDGKHWTARQDMGPGPRAFHAMAFDAVRARVVLFGGSPVPPSVPNAGAAVAGDTWEQFGGGGAATNAGPVQPSAVVAVSSVSVAPNPAPASGGPVTFTVTLSSPAAAAAAVDLFADGETTAFLQVPIAAGATNGSATVAIPAISPASMTITARSGASQASTNFVLQ